MFSVARLDFQTVLFLVCLYLQRADGKKNGEMRINMAELLVEPDFIPVKKW